MLLMLGLHFFALCTQSSSLCLSKATVNNNKVTKLGRVTGDARFFLAKCQPPVVKLDWENALQTNRKLFEQ
jgi:hypothetical protein